MCIVYTLGVLTCVSLISGLGLERSDLEIHEQGMPIPWALNTSEISNGTLSVINHTIQINPRIIGGDIATDRSRFPYQASLRQASWFSTNHFCGATIIHTRHVLTAAHCVVANGNVASTSGLRVVVGDLNIIQPTGLTVSRNVANIFAHPQYSEITLQHDIAVLRLTQPFNSWTTFINTIPLATSSPPDNTSCVVSGWGVTAVNGSLSSVLRFVTVPSINRNLCMQLYGSNNILSGMLCAGYLPGGRDACQGDSGGPLVCNYELSGVVSWGYQCALPGFPGVYADVAFYRNWINRQIERSSSYLASSNPVALFMAVYLVINST